MPNFNNMTATQKMAAIIKLSADKNALKKAVFSKPSPANILRAVATLRSVGKKAALQIEYFTKDNKALHKNYFLDSASFETDIAEEIGQFMQINLITVSGDCEYKRSKSGNDTVLGFDKLLRALEAKDASEAPIDMQKNNNKKDYILKAKEHYSSREFERQLDSAYYERYMLSSGKQPPELVSQTVRNSILDTYVLEFLDLPEQYSERNFRKAIIQNLKQFILEFGKDFTFIGEEYRVQVGGQDFFIDLLFYNRALSCLVPIELKIGKFKPEHIGQINFYLEALDRDVKKPNENPSVGLILCASKDDAVVEYALSRSMSPTLVSDYTLCLPDKQILKDKLQELAELALEDGEDISEE